MKQFRQSLLIFTLLAEGFLILIALVWIYFRELPVNFELTLNLILLGCLATIPLLLLNGILYVYSNNSPDNPYRQFLNKYIFPICHSQTTTSALIISTLAGVGEELFFRAALFGELQIWLGFWPALLFTNFLFAYVHFIGIAKAYWRLVLFYFLFGVYFSFLYLFFDSIWLVAWVHGTYNFIVILFLSWLIKNKKAQPTLIKELTTPYDNQQ